MGEEKDYLEVNLPPYLREDLDNLIEGRKLIISPWTDFITRCKAQSM